VKASKEIALLRNDLADLLDGSSSSALTVKRGFVYQPASAASGLTVSYELRRPDHTIYESGTAEEVDLTGRYVKIWTLTTPDTWYVLINDSAGGKACKMF